MRPQAPFQSLVAPISVVLHGYYDALDWPVSQTEVVLVVSTGQDPYGDSVSCLSTPDAFWDRTLSTGHI